MNRITLKNIHKSFGDNVVLSGVNLDIHAGEVHALMGENGAGKSTLMNILTGGIKDYSGSITIDGIETSYKNPTEAETAGITFIHQEINTFPEMTVLENLFAGKERNKYGLLDTKSMREAANRVFADLGTNLPLNTPAKNLSVGSQQMIEIAKSLMTNCKVLIMDEPTAALTDRECAKLFDIIADLKKKNVAIIYISHRMEEIFKICDKITVMRDGVSIDTKLIKDTHLDEVVTKLVGRDIKDYYPTREAYVPKDPVLSINGLSSDTFKDISFTLHQGEILGFFGLMGSGRTEIMRTIFGLDKLTGGDIHIFGEKVTKPSPKKSIDHGVAFVTENRKTEGLILDFSIDDNLSLPNIDALSTFLVQSKKEAQYTQRLIELLLVKTKSGKNPASSLSGGNQQKVVLAKWIGIESTKIIILDEPTRGIDVGAKQEIYKLISALTKQGVSILLVSSDLPEVMGLSDNIAVMFEGRLSGILSKEEITKEKIMRLATGGSKQND